MKLFTKTAMLTAALAVSATPALALPPQVPDNRGTAHIPDNRGTQRAPDKPGRPENPGSQGSSNRPSSGSSMPGPRASRKAKRRAYGRVCAEAHLSKKHVKGERGTPFSKCVNAMARLGNEQTRSPSKACRTESKKHVKGKKGTPFSQCVKAGAQMRKDLKGDEGEDNSQTASDS